MMKSIILGLLSLFIVLQITGCKKDSNPIETIPNIPDTVIIGTQTWMKKNLDISTYRNGDVIPQVTDTTQWSKLTTGAWCYYNNDPANGTKYGKLYNWYAVTDPRGLAPAGWHIPARSEWDILDKYIGMTQVEIDQNGIVLTDKGGKLKTIGTTHWQAPNTGATDESGFSGTPGGIRSSYGISLNIGFYGYWWATDPFDADPNQAWYRDLYSNYTFIYKGTSFKTIGLSVRCVKD